MENTNDSGNSLLHGQLMWAIGAAHITPTPRAGLMLLAIHERKIWGDGKKVSFVKLPDETVKRNNVFIDNCIFL